MSAPSPYNILGLRQFRELTELRATEVDDGSPKLKLVQEFMRRYMSPPYGIDRMCAVHKVGTGKTLGAVVIAEDRRHISSGCTVLVKGAMSAANFKRKILRYHEIIDSGMREADILQYYTIEHFFRFRNAAMADMDAVVRQHSNRLVIIDEFHNLRSSDRDDDNDVDHDTDADDWHKTYDIIKTVFDKAVNVVVILLTATPVCDMVSEILLTAAFLCRGLHISRNDMNRIDAAEPDKVVEVFKDIVPRDIGAKISFYNNKDSRMPATVYVGQKEHGDLCFRENTVVLPFGEMQQLDWDDVIKKDAAAKTLIAHKREHIFNVRIAHSVFSYHGKSGRELLADGLNLTKARPMIEMSDTVRADLRLPGLARYSSKIAYIVASVLKIRGRVLVTTDIIDNGILPIAAALEANGYTRHHDTHLPPDAAPRYIVCTGKTKYSPNNNNTLLALFNHPSNLDGSRIQILLVSRVMCECIDISNTVAVFMIMPHWNVSRETQTIGRVVRTDSHKGLDLADQGVKVHILAAVSRSPRHEYARLADYSIDAYILDFSKRKDAAAQAIYSYLKSISIDCYLHSPEAMDPSVTIVPITSDISYYRHHVPQQAPGVYNYLLKKFSASVTCVDAGILMSEFHLDSRGLAIVVDILRRNVAYLFTSLAAGTYTVYISHRGQVVFTQSIVTHALEEYRHRHTPIMWARQDEYQEPTPDKLAKVDAMVRYIIERFSTADPAYSNLMLHSICDSLMWRESQQTICILEHALVNYPASRRLFLRIFYTHIYVVDGRLCHILQYRGHSKSAAYSVSSIKFVAKGLTRSYDPITRSWGTLKLQCSDWQRIEKKIIAGLTDKFKQLDRTFKYTLRLCPEDRKDRIRELSVRGDSRMGRRGQQLDSLSVPYYVYHLGRIAARSLLISAALCTQYNTTNVEQALAQHLHKMPARACQGIMIDWMSMCGSFVIS